MKPVHFWTLIIVPSFCTVGQIQTGDNFSGVGSSPESESFLDSHFGSQHIRPKEDETNTEVKTKPLASWQGVSIVGS